MHISPRSQDLFPSYASAHWSLSYRSLNGTISGGLQKREGMLCHTAAIHTKLWAPIYFKQNNVYFELSTWTDFSLASYLSLTVAIENIIKAGDKDTYQLTRSRLRHRTPRRISNGS
jgi:hypothetical protein